MATAAGRTAPTGGARTPAQTFALVFGAVYLLVGLVGFAVTQFGLWIADPVEPGEKLLIFHLTDTHNLIHLAIGAAWLVASRRHDTARTANLGIGAVYILVALLGFLEVEFVVNLLNLADGAGDPDNFLHIVSGAAGVFFGTAGAEGTATRTGATA